jgi:hypothetical protein
MSINQIPILTPLSPRTLPSSFIHMSIKIKKGEESEEGERKFHIGFP